MRLNLIKTQDYLSVQKRISLFVKQGRVRTIKRRIRLLFNCFDNEVLKICSSKEGGYKNGGKSKIFSISIKSEDHLFQMRCQETPDFQEMA